MIESFHDSGTEDVFDRSNTNAARRVCPQQLWKIAQRKLDQLNTVDRLEALRVPPGNFLEALRGDRDGQFSIRINSQYRVCFFWTDEGASEVAIVDYH